MPRALAIQTKLKKIQKAGIEMDGNESEDENEFIEVLYQEMPAVLKEMDEAIDLIKDCEDMLEQLKTNKSVELMKKLQAGLNDAEQKVEHKEVLSGKLEPELTQWDPHGKLERRDQELDYVEDQVEQFENKLQHEQSFFEREMANIEKKEAAGSGSLDGGFVKKVEAQKQGLMELIQDAEELMNENELVKQEHDQIWPKFDSEIPQSVKKIRPKKRKPSTIDSGIPEDEKRDIYVMISTNCRHRKPIKDLCAKVRALKAKIDDYDRKYAPLKAELQKKEEPKKYVAIAGCAIDKMFAEAINRSAYGNLRIVRLEQGKYMFGTKKIMAKIINGKLVIRVGGGYMSVDEFIEQYGRMELMKVIAEEEKEKEALGHHEEEDDHHLDQADPRKSLRRVQERTDALMAKDGAQLKGSMRKTMFNQINTYGEDKHMGNNTTSLAAEERHGISQAKITGSSMRKTMHGTLGASPKNRGLTATSPLNASGGMRRSTHKSPANQSHR